MQVWKNASGQYHRLDGPAIIYSNGHQHWYQNDLLHRLDGPAYVGDDGHEQWYKNGQLHRVDGPAIINKDSQRWYINDQLHRVDGPACIGFDYEQWYISGNNISDDMVSWIKEYNIPNDYTQWTDIHRFLFRLRF